jgi:hypothetical protein
MGLLYLNTTSQYGSSNGQLNISGTFIVSFTWFVTQITTDDQFVRLSWNCIFKTSLGGTVVGSFIILANPKRSGRRRRVETHIGA